MNIFYYTVIIFTIPSASLLDTRRLSCSEQRGTDHDLPSEFIHNSEIMAKCIDINV